MQMIRLKMKFRVSLTSAMAWSPSSSPSILFAAVHSVTTRETDRAVAEVVRISSETV